MLRKKVHFRLEVRLGLFWVLSQLLCSGHSLSYASDCLPANGLPEMSALTQMQMIARIASLNTSNGTLNCADLPKDEGSVVALVEELDQQCLKGSQSSCGDTKWPSGKPSEPTKDFFNHLASCFDQTAQQSADPKVQALYDYAESSVFSTANAVYGDHDAGVLSYRFIKKSFETDHHFRPALLGFTQTLASSMECIPGWQRGFAAAIIGTNFTSDLAELQTAVSALSSNDPDKLVLVGQLTQVAHVLGVGVDAASPPPKHIR
jgi:hypothetical protein